MTIPSGDTSLPARVARRLAVDGAPARPPQDGIRDELERTLGAPVPPLLWIFFSTCAQGGIGPLHGTFSLHDRTEGSLWELLQREGRERCWLPAFDLGCGQCLLVDASDDEARIILVSEFGAHQLEVDLVTLLEQWLAGTLDPRAWFVFGPPTGRVLRFGDRVAALPAPAIDVRGIRLR